MVKNTTVYVALLRGINVGGKNKVDMKKLKTSFEKAGMTSVTTYINSGNIVFTSKETNKKKLAHILESAITKTFNLSIKVVLRNFEEYSNMMKALPKSWTNDEKMKSDVLFLWDEVDNKSSLQQLTIKPGIDTVTYTQGAILWMIQRKNQTKSGLLQIVKTKLYKQVTVRNVNTVRKIFQIMENT